MRECRRTGKNLHPETANGVCAGRFFRFAAWARVMGRFGGSGLVGVFYSRFRFEVMTGCEAKVIWA